MRAYLRHTALATAAAASVFVAAPQQAKAQTYPIDCAILLCLSGGWPASVPCARARAEFIRRITPWPVEPPLQIWRCPMGASFEADPDRLSPTRIWDALLDDVEMPLQSFPGAPLTDEDPALAPQPAVFRHESGGAAMPLPEGFSLQLAQDHGRAARWRPSLPPIAFPAGGAITAPGFPCARSSWTGATTTATTAGSAWTTDVDSLWVVYDGPHNPVGLRK